MTAPISQERRAILTHYSTCEEPAQTATRLWADLSAIDALPDHHEISAVAELIEEAGYLCAPTPLAEDLMVTRPLLASTGLTAADSPLTYAIGELDVTFAHRKPDDRVG